MAHGYLVGILLLAIETAAFARVARLHRRYPSLLAYVASSIIAQTAVLAAPGMWESAVPAVMITRALAVWEFCRERRFRLVALVAAQALISASGRLFTAGGLGYAVFGYSRAVWEAAFLSTWGGMALSMAALCWLVDELRPVAANVIVMPRWAEARRRRMERKAA